MRHLMRTFGGMLTLAVSVAEAGGTCSDNQTIVIDARTRWSCELSAGSGAPRLIRVRQDNVDVLLEIVDTRGTRVVAVDAPNRRASPELAVIVQAPGSKYVVQLRSVDRERVAGAVDVSIGDLRSPETAPLVRGLLGLTQAAAVGDGASGITPERRVELLRAAADRLVAGGATNWQAEVLLRIAGVYYWMLDDYMNCANAADEAMEAFRRLGDVVMQSRAAVLRSAALLEVANAMRQVRRAARTERSQFDEAIALLQRAARDFHSAALVYDEGHAVNFLGIALYYQGDYVGARTRYTEAAALFASVDAAISAALPLQNIAMIDYDTGDYARAIDSYRSLLKVLTPDDSAVQYVTVILNMANAHYVLGEFESALRSFVMALQLCEQKRFLIEQARSLHGLGMVYLSIGDRDRASAFFQQALTLRRSLADSDPRGLQTSLLRVGDLRRESGDVRGALELHLEALDRALTVIQKARALHAIGLDHAADNAQHAALRAYENALQLGLPEESPARVELVGAYGRAKLHAGDDSGRALILEAALAQEASGNRDLAAAEYLALAQEEEDAGRTASALGNVQKAIALQESQRLRAISPDLRATYIANRATAFELQSDLLIQLAKRTASAKERQKYLDSALLAYDDSRRRMLEDFRELAQPPADAMSGSATSRELAELDAQVAAKRHRLAALLEQPSPPSAQVESLRNELNLLRARVDLAQGSSTKATAESSRSRRQPRSIRDIQRTIDADTALVAYQLGEERSSLWYLTRDAMSAFALPGRSEVQQAARDLHASWSALGTPEDGLAREMSASRLLLGPVATLLRTKRALIVVPDGDLRVVPFGALWLESDSKHGARRLIESHAVSYRPALGAMSVGDATAAVHAEPSRILLIGDPKSPQDASTSESWGDPWAWQALPGSRHEIESIEKIASTWQRYVLMGAEATKPALLSLPLDTFRTLHFATHARMDVMDPQLSSIALSSKQASFGALSSTLSVREIVGFRLNAETVVLSACEASLGKDYRGHLSFGLSEAFLLAGARNVLGSLWRVSDEATQVYMRSFYGQYVRNQVTPVAAAQMAARAVSSEPRYGHPYFWAAFVVTQQ